MNHADMLLHVRGESRYIDDQPLPAGGLFAAVCPSRTAHARLTGIDTRAATALPGVVAIFTAADIPGENQIGGIVADEPLLADGEVHFLGQPVALVVATTAATARDAVRAIQLDEEPLPAVFDPRMAFRKGMLIIPPRTFSCGDPDSAWAECDVIVEGTVETGGQEHLYLETQSALARYDEGGKVHVASSTQSPTSVQRTVARILGLPMNQVETETLRLGGGFGGKEDQATPWATLAALAAWKLKRPVKLVLNRGEDLRMTGKRHPYSSDFRLGLNSEGKILAYEVLFYQNAGAAADLSPAILDRTLFHATGSYAIPHVRATGFCCRTNLPPFTAFRGFGGPQGMFVIESAIDKAARFLGLPAWEIQRRNLLQEGDKFYYGQPVTACRAGRCWHEAERTFHFDDLDRRLRRFNETHATEKKGAARMPLAFGISFTNTFLNQAGALVHVYSDGSVGVSTGAVEMGQGVNHKIATIVARTFGIDPARVRMTPTSTTTVANTSATAASTGCDLNGMAARLAAQTILDRLLGVAREEAGAGPETPVQIVDGQVLLAGQATSLSWEKLVARAHFRRISLSSWGFYAPDGIHFDNTRGQGSPFCYHVYGTARIEATVDLVRGTYTIDRVEALHDGGDSLSPLIDRGQAEGAILQGIGWLTCEELVYDATGRLRSDTLSTYKVPGIGDCPPQFQVEFLADAANPKAVLGSKAIGEPPFMYGIAAWFAIQNALSSAYPDREPVYGAPMTPERSLMWLAGGSPAGASKEKNDVPHP